jgi:phage FluMu protein Com
MSNKLERMRCSKCGTEAIYGEGIGHYCPNKECDNIDGVMAPFDKIDSQVCDYCEGDTEYLGLFEAGNEEYPTMKEWRCKKCNQVTVRLSKERLPDEERRIEESDWYDIMWVRMVGDEFVDVLLKEEKKVVRIWEDGQIIIEKWDGI